MGLWQQAQQAAQQNVDTGEDDLNTAIGEAEDAYNTAKGTAQNDAQNAQDTGQTVVQNVITAITTFTQPFRDTGQSVLDLVQSTGQRTGILLSTVSYAEDPKS